MVETAVHQCLLEFLLKVCQGPHAAQYGTGVLPDGTVNHKPLEGNDRHIGQVLHAVAHHVYAVIKAEERLFGRCFGDCHHNAVKDAQAALNYA